jgi:hypothetical protein
VNDTGSVYGRKAIEKSYADFFQQWRVSNHISKRDQYSPHIIGTTGEEAWSNGEWSLTLQGQSGGPIQVKGYWASVDVREGDAWKDRMHLEPNCTTGRVCSDEIKRLDRAARKPIAS